MGHYYKNFCNFISQLIFWFLFFWCPWQPHDGEQRTDYATYEKQYVWKTTSDEQKQQATESGNNLIEMKKDEAVIEKDKLISESIDDNHSQDVTCELRGKIENLTDDNKVEQMVGFPSLW